MTAKETRTGNSFVRWPSSGLVGCRANELTDMHEPASPITPPLSHLVMSLDLLLKTKENNY